MSTSRMQLLRRIDRLLHDDLFGPRLDPQREDNQLMELAAEWNLLSAYLVGHMSSGRSAGQASQQLVEQQLLVVTTQIRDLPHGPEKTQLESLLRRLEVAVAELLETKKD